MKLIAVDINIPTQTQQLISQVGGITLDEQMFLDVHLINHLQATKVPMTNDEAKYDYTCNNGKYGEGFNLKFHSQ